MEYPQKENAMLVDIQYVPASRKDNTPDQLYTVWKDLDTGQKHLLIKDEPTMDIYFTKPDCRDYDYNKSFEYVDRLEKHHVKYSKIPYEIANEWGPSGKDIINRSFETKNRSLMKELYLYPYSFGADCDVRTWYRMKWLSLYNNDRPKDIDKGFLDIECDSIFVKGMPTPQTGAINAVTIVNKTTMECYTFLLTTQNCGPVNSELKKLFDNQQKQIDALIENLDSFKRDLHKRFDDIYGVMDYNLRFYNDERKLLVQLWQLINLWKLDIVEIWNMPFDIPYILERMEFLGLDPKEYACHPDFPVKRCYFKKDKRNFSVENKTDFFYLSSYTLFICQMTLYAATRKGGTKLRSYKLNSIGKKVVGDTKIDYSDEGDFKTLPYTNYPLFVIYNIKDVLLQSGIEERTNDADSYYTASYENATPYDAVFKQTVKIKNARYMSYFDQGLIPSNNFNAILNASYNSDSKKDDDEDDDDDGFEGALVADPQYNDAIGIPLYGKPSNNIFELVIDMDMSSFYPSSIIAMNIDPSTLMFKVIVEKSQFDNGEVKYNGIIKYDETDVDISKDVFDNLQSGNILSFGHKWFNMPSIEDALAECERRLTN